MGFFDGLIGGALDIVGGIISADMQNSASEGMQANNIAWQREQLQNKHQWEVEDLRKAGLNPILSAANASSAVSAGSPQGANPDIKLSKTLEALSNSALMQKQEDIAEYDAQTRRISATAQKIIAQTERDKTPSAIGVNEMQAGWYSMQTELARSEWPFKQAMYKANIDKTQQDILNSIRLITAQVDYYSKAGQAQLMQGAASMESARAQSRIAAAHELNAQINAENGEVRRAVDRALEGEADARTVEAYQRIEGQKWQLERDKYSNPGAAGAPVSAGSILMGIGEVLRNGIGGSVNWSVK